MLRIALLGPVTVSSTPPREDFRSDYAGKLREKLAVYKAAGVQRVFIWPVRDELNQLTQFQKKIAPLVDR